MDLLRPATSAAVLDSTARHPDATRIAGGTGLPARGAMAHRRPATLPGLAPVHGSPR